MEYQAKHVPYQKVKKSRPKTATGPWIGKSSYGSNFQKWDIGGPPEKIKQKATVVPMPFKAHTAYQETFKGKKSSVDPDNIYGKDGIMRKQVPICKPPNLSQLRQGC
jgi:hypothetical protein